LFFESGFHLSVNDLVIAKEIAQAVIRAEPPRGDNAPAARPALHHNDGTREEIAVADEDKVSLVAHAPPAIMGDKFRHFGVARPRFAAHLHRGCILFEAAASVA
jgi:hypothetical protein